MGRRGIALLVLSLRIRWTQILYALLALPLGKNPVAHCTGRWVGRKKRSGLFWRRENLFRVPELEPRTVQPLAIHYTVYAASYIKRQ